MESAAPDQIVSGSELAAILGCRPSYIVELKRHGRLVPNPDGKGYLRAASVALYNATRDPSRAGVAARHAEARGAPLVGAEAYGEAADAGEREDLAGQGSDAARRAKALADKAEADARAAQLDLEERLGNLLPARRVERMLSEAATGIRNALERMADTLAPQLAATTDESRCRQLVWDEVSHALEELSRGFRVAAQQAREEGEDD